MNQVNPAEFDAALSIPRPAANPAGGCAEGASLLQRARLRGEDYAVSIFEEKNTTEISIPERLPRVGFAGVGWIGLQRLQSIAQSGLTEIVAVADPSKENVAKAAAVIKGIKVADDAEELLGMELDGLVIATPNYLHAEQTISALEKGISVFCQKPLARTADATRRVVEAARRSNRLLAVDLSYRGLTGIQKIRQLIQSGELGKVFAADLTFHNAYGPDKPWFYDIRCSGGGCVIDLGVHLIDLALWCLDYPNVREVSSKLFSKGELLTQPAAQLEDFAVACLGLENGANVQLSCSWRLPAGCDAIIAASFYGTQGGAELQNVNGSFTDFTAARFVGTRREPLAAIGEPWAGRQAVEWARRLGLNPCFDPEMENQITVASTLDQIYGR